VADGEIAALFASLPLVDLAEVERRCRCRSERCIALGRAL
jgi:hypothetical protein